MLAITLVSLGAAALLPLTDGFMAPRVLVTREHRACRSLLKPRTRMQQAQSGGGQPMSYADRLRQARASRQTAVAQDQDNKISTGPPEAAAASVAADLPATGQEEPEALFSQTVFEELRTAITILAARLQREGPITRSEFERFEEAVAVIIEDAMPRQELPTVPGSSAPPPMAAMPPTAGTGGGVAVSSTDELESEGPAWDPDAKSYGLPTDTTNTYTIEGMGAMNPNEYQQALRERVTARARSARESGAYGNIVSNDYLKFLSKNPKTPEELSQERAKHKGYEDFKRY